MISVMKTGQSTSKESISFYPVGAKPSNMDVDIFTSWVSQPDVCRCCLSTTGCFDVTESFYTESGVLELYADMLFECYGIKLSYLMEWGPSRLMCSSCVQQLRNAYNFKKQVKVAEKHFIEYFRKKDNTKLLTGDEASETNDVIGDDDIKIEDESNDDDDGCHDDEVSEDKQKEKVVPAQEKKLIILVPKRKLQDTNLNEDVSKPKKVVFDLANNIPFAKSSKDTVNIKEIKNVTDISNVEQVKNVKTVRILKQVRDINKIKNLNQLRRITGVKNIKDIKNIKYVKNVSDLKKVSDRNNISAIKISDVKSKKAVEIVKPVKNVQEANKTKEVDKTKDLEVPDSFQELGTYGKKLLQQLVSLQRGVRTDNTHLRSNIALILKNSTIIPFQHLFKREFGCLYCERKFWFYPELKKHVESAHGDITEDEIIKSVPVPQNLVKADISDIRCKLCMKACFKGRTSNENTSSLSDRERSDNFETIESFVDHLVKFHKRVYMQISRVTPSHGLLGLHMSTDEIKCHICQKTFRIFTQLSSHMNEHYSSFICQICGKRLLSKVRLDNHMNKHNTEIFKCELCGKVFGQRSTKLQHLRRVHGHQKYECFICHEIFAKYNQRLKHLEEKHDIKNPVYKCDYCHKQLPSASSFNKHIKRNHHIKNDYICDVCGKSFTSKYSIADHLTIHTGVKNYVCEYCDKRFRARSTLKLHVQGHLNIKPFACTLCEAAFIQKHCLKNHIRVHHPSVEISSGK